MAQAASPKASFSRYRELFGGACTEMSPCVGLKTPQLYVNQDSPGMMAEPPVAVSMDVPMFLVVWVAFYGLMVPSQRPMS